MDGRGLEGAIGPRKRGHFDADFGGRGGRVEEEMPVGEPERGIPNIRKDQFMLAMAGFQSGPDRAGAGRQPAGAAMLAFFALAAAVGGVEFNGAASSGFVADDQLGERRADGEEDVKPDEDERHSPMARHADPPHMHPLIVAPRAGAVNRPRPASCLGAPPAIE